MTEKDIPTSTRHPRISPLRYPGGKAVLYPRLRKLIQDMGLRDCTYVEPYAGGVGAGLGLLVTGQVKRVVINDLDPAIYSFWKTIQDNPGWLTKRISKADLTVTEWRKQREIYKQGDTTRTAELGFATFYLNRTNRSGVLNAGPIGGFDQTGHYKIDARFNRENLCKRIRTLAMYSESIIPMSKDGIEVINEYSTKDDVFIYADPPYFEKAKSLYLNAFNDQDHISLADVLNSHPRSPWLLTYDNVPQVATLYENRRRQRFTLNYSANRVGKATEIAVFSDSLPITLGQW